MLAHVRVGLVAALVTLASFAFSSIPASAADKAFQRGDLDEAAIKLEAEIKNDAGSAGKPLAQLRRDADAAFQKNDVRNGMVLLGQIIAQAPDDSATWLRLARAIQQIRVGRSIATASRCSSAPAPPPTSPISAPRTATRRPTLSSSSAAPSATASVWRPALDALRLSLELREIADVRALYEKMREDHGFRLLDYTVDADCGVAARLLPVLRGRCPASAPTSRRSSRSPARTSSRSPPTTSSSASKGSSTASATA